MKPVIAALLIACATVHVSAQNLDEKSFTVYKGAELKAHIEKIRAYYSTRGFGIPETLSHTHGDIDWDSIVSIDPYCVRANLFGKVEVIPLANFEEGAQQAFGYSRELAAAFVQKRDSGDVMDALSKEVVKRTPYNLADKPEATWKKVYEEIKAARMKEAPSSGDRCNGHIIQHIEGDSYLVYDEDKKTTARLDFAPGSKQLADGEKFSLKLKRTSELYEYTSVQNSKKRVAVWKEDASNEGPRWLTYEEFMARLKNGQVEKFERRVASSCTFCDGTGEIVSGLNRNIIPCRRCQGTPRTINVTIYEAQWRP